MATVPKELEGKLHWNRFADYEADWSIANRRRGELIDKDISGKGLSSAERSELDGLQAYADYHLEQVARRPTHDLEYLEQFSIPADDGLTESVRVAARNLASLTEQDCGAKNGVTALYWAIHAVLVAHTSKK